MVYLDYAKTTPMSYEVLDAYNKIAKDYFAICSSAHKLGEKSLNLYKDRLKNIAELLNVMESEITFTSGATEANNLALVGTIMANPKAGNHIIVSKFEDESIYKICRYLEKIGYEISYVSNDSDGLIDFENLKSLIKENTVLVSICALNAEIGIRQPLKMIRQIIKKVNSNTLFHSDMSLAIGRIPVNFRDVDLASVSSHKIFGPKGIGLFYHNDRVKVSPLVFGMGINELNPITYSLPNIYAFSVALSSALTDLDKKDHFVTRLNEKLCNEISKYDNIEIIKTKYTNPYIICLNLNNLDASLFEKILSEDEIYISSKHNEVNNGLLAIGYEESRCKNTLRICLSYKTTTDEVNAFIEGFKKVYKNLSLGE